MTQEYYHLAPVIMTDELYALYGGRVADSNEPQRNVAYTIAEMQMIRELQTTLLPTTVTGTFLIGANLTGRLCLPFNRVISVDAVTFLSSQSACDCSVREDAGCHFIADSSYGYIDVRRLTSAYLACGCTVESPYQIQVAYTAGLPTGVAAQDPSLHLALAIVSELALLEIVDPKGLEGGPGDPGVQEWVSMGYGEKRTKLETTVFGSSARANRARNLVKHLRKKSVLRMG